MPWYKVAISGNAWVTTTYRVEAQNDTEAERLAKTGEFPVELEEVTDQEETYTEVKIDDSEDGNERIDNRD